MKIGLKIEDSFYINMMNVVCWEQSNNRLSITTNACGDNYYNRITVGVYLKESENYSDISVSENNFQRIIQELNDFMEV